MITLHSIAVFMVPVAIFAAGAASAFLVLKMQGFTIIQTKELHKYLKELELYKLLFEMW